MGLENNNIRDEGATALAEAFKSATTIHNLWLCGNSIGAEGAKAICEASIKELDLRNNNIGDEGAMAIAEALKTASTLQEFWTLVSSPISHLNLINIVGGNSAWVMKAWKQAKKLNYNSRSLTLNLCSNQIGDEGATAIAAALNTNSTLQEQHLGENNISESLKSRIKEELSSERRKKRLLQLESSTS